MSARHDEVDDSTRTKAPAPEDGTPGRRVLAFWEGGFCSRPLDDGARLSVGRAKGSDIEIRHASVSRAHAVIVGADPPRVEDMGSANGTRIGGVAVKPRATAVAPPGVMIEVGSAMLVIQESGASREERPAGVDVAEPTPMGQIDKLVARLAPSALSVLLLGETGVGKGVVAESIHRRSQRAAGPFLPLNCGALPESLLESELFGHEKGAFTGAVASTPGLLESAQGGTIFLDEVGELPPATQVKLLRVLENREVLRVGARRPTPIDVRIVSATNRDLRALVATGQFRQDLYFRLNGISITIPPLRERRGEIAELARLFAAEAAQKADVPPPLFSDAAAQVLATYAFPGNVRELRNVIERAVFLAGADAIAPEHLGLSGEASWPTVPPGPPPSIAPPSDPRKLRSDLQQFERQRIEQALEEALGNQTKAAELLGISRRTLLRRLDEHGLPRPRKSDSDPEE